MCCACSAPRGFCARWMFRDVFWHLNIVRFRDGRFDGRENQLWNRLWFWNRLWNRNEFWRLNLWNNWNANGLPRGRLRNFRGRKPVSNDARHDGDVNAF